MPDSIHLSAVVLTYNSERLLKKVLDSVKFADELLVIDSGSSDQTLAIAQDAEARIIAGKPIESWAEVRNAALQEAKGEWVLFVDSDEIVSPELKASIQKAVEQNTTVGFYLQRRDHFMGKLLLHGNTADKLLRLGKKEAGTWIRPVHEIWEVKGKTDTLPGYLYHYSHPTITSFITKANYYTDIDAKEAYKNGARANGLTILLYPIAKFKTVYFLKLGILDGVPGLVFAMLDATYSFLKRAKIWALGRE